MGDNQPLHKMELTFFGTITASISHELNNVLSIINEYCGLLDDLLAANDKGPPIENDRIKKIAFNIANQIKREQNIIKLLNRFSHRIDNPLVQFNLNELVADISQLSQRFASLKKIDLSIDIAKEPINLTNNPFSVQHIIFLCLKLAMDWPLNIDSINVILETTESRAVIKIESPTVVINQETEKMINLISDLSKKLSGDSEIFILENNRQVQQISIPLFLQNGPTDH